MNHTEYDHLLRLLDTTLFLIDRRAENPARLQRRLGALLIEVALLRARLAQPLPSSQRN